MLVRKNGFSSARPGFTLIEMMLVVAIIVVLGGIAVVSYSAYSDHATATRIGGDIKTIDAAIVTFSSKNGGPPEQLTDLADPSKDPFGNVYIAQKYLVDPWGTPYAYDRNGTRNANSPAGTPKTPDVYCERDNWQIGNYTNYKKIPK